MLVSPWCVWDRERAGDQPRLLGCAGPQSCVSSLVQQPFGATDFLQDTRGPSGTGLSRRPPRCGVRLRDLTPQWQLTWEEADPRCCQHQGATPELGWADADLKPGPWMTRARTGERPRAGVTPKSLSTVGGGHSDLRECHRSLLRLCLSQCTKWAAVWLLPGPPLGQQCCEHVFCPRRTRPQT